MSLLTLTEIKQIDFYSQWNPWKTKGSDDTEIPYFPYSQRIYFMKLVTLL